MKITILCVGKIKEKYLAEGIREYSKRLGRYCRLETIEVPDEKTPDGASRMEERKIREKEGERLARYLKEDAYTVALEINGTQLDSVELSGKIEALGVDGVSHIMFVIGGSLGLDEQTTSRANLHLSFSRMTFPHQLMRLLLLEQIYRGYRIMVGAPYHK